MVNMKRNNPVREIYLYISIYIVLWIITLKINVRYIVLWITAQKSIERYIQRYLDTFPHAQEKELFLTISIEREELNPLCQQKHLFKDVGQHRMRIISEV